MNTASDEGEYTLGIGLVDVSITKQSWRRAGLGISRFAAVRIPRRNREM
ncbi:hypothetical protein [Lysobacter capsici]